MASRVNRRFVVILAVVLSVCFVLVATVGYFVVRRTPEKLATQAAALMAQTPPNYEKAADLYARAVNKDQANPARLEQWIDAIRHVTPKSPQDYRDRFSNEYMAALRTLADVRRTDIAACKRFLDEMFLLSISNFTDQRGWEYLAEQCEKSLRNFAANPADGKPLLRYRGMARTGILRLGGNLDREKVDLARADLRAALEVNPADSEAVVALSDIDRIMAGAARQNQDTATADPMLAAARATLADFLKSHPNDPVVLLQLLRFDAIQAIRKAQAEHRPVAEPTPEQRELADRLFAAMREPAAASLEPPTIANIASYAVNVPDRGDEGLAITDRALETRPDNSLLLLVRAELLSRAGKTDEAVTTLQKIIDLKDKPVSLDGWLLISIHRSRAAARQVDFTLAPLAKAKNAQERAEILAKAKGYRDALVARVGQERPEVKLSDARIKYLEGDYVASRIILTAYIEREGARDADAQSLLGEILLRSGDNGAARRCFERVAELNPSHINARLLLAHLAVQSGEIAAAEAQLAAAAQIDPGNKDIQKQLADLREYRAGDMSTDPIVLAIREAETKTVGANADRPAAVQILREAIKKNGQDIRLVSMLVQLLVGVNDKPGAIEVVENALKTSPDDVRLQQIRRALNFDNPLQMQLDTIDSLDISEVQKHVQKCTIYASAGKDTEALAELELAKKIDPENKSVLELRFMKAISDKDFEEARTIGDKAVAANADGLSGLSFKGRLALAEGRFEDASVAFQQASDIDRFNPLAWRFLGDARISLKDYAGAATAYNKALETRPNDLACVKGSIRAAYLAGNLDQALIAARKASNNANIMADSDFQNVWLGLEGSAPAGDKYRALAVRTAIAKQRPDDKGNKLALADLMISLKQFADSRKIVDELLAAPDAGTEAIYLNARWRGASGDLPGAEKVFVDYIESIPEDKRTDDPYIRLANLQAYSGKLDQAIATMTTGAKYQKPEELGADRELAMLYIRNARYQDAEKTLRRIIDSAKSDPGNNLLKGIVECKLQLGQFEEAERTIAQLGDAAAKDQSLLLLQARAATGRKDLTRARQLYDKAVAAAPELPLGYYGRAEFILADDPDRAQDAEADLLAAVRTEPRFILARKRLYQIMMKAGRPDEAVAQLREALNADPDDDTVRMTMVNVLVERGQAKAACAYIEEGLRRKPDSIVWATLASDVFVKAGVPQDALGILRHAWEVEKSVLVALAYTEIILNVAKPDLALARDIVSTPSLSPEKNFQLLLTRARIYQKAGQDRDAETDIAAAYKLIDCGKADIVTAFFNGLNAIYPGLKDQVRILDKLQASAEFTEWCQLNDLAIRVIDKTSRSALLPKLEAVASDPKAHPDVSFAANSLLANIAGEERRFEDGAKHFRKCVELRPDNAEVNNNLAFILCEELKRPQEALPFAEKGVALNPVEPGILDTLGTVQMRLSDLTKADATFQRALAITTNREKKAPVFLHLAELRLMQGNKTEARHNIELLQGVLDQYPGLKTPYGQQLETLRKKIDAS